MKSCDRACTAAAADSALERRRQPAERYRPEAIDVLLVAEAPTAALGRYFHFPRVLEQDSLFRYVCRVLLDRQPSREGKEQLLADFRDRGVFLIDLKETPVDGTRSRRTCPHSSSAAARSRRGGSF